MITILSFYKLKKIKKLKNLKTILFEKIDILSIKGLIILSPEGINGTISGTPKSISVARKYLLFVLNISKFDVQNITHSKFVPFLKAKINALSIIIFFLKLLLNGSVISISLTLKIDELYVGCWKIKNRSIVKKII